MHTSVHDPDMTAALREYLAAAHGPFVFPIGSAYRRAGLMRELLVTLRTARPDLEARSLRRGTLCCMAANGASEQELLMWSRHTTAAALRLALRARRTGANPALAFGQTW